jgi:hypothetical protein
MEEPKVIAVFDKDNRKYHHFVITEGQGIVGTLYIPKGTQVPDEVIVALRIENEGNNE